MLEIGGAEFVEANGPDVGFGVPGDGVNKAMAGVVVGVVPADSLGKVVGVDEQAEEADDAVEFGVGEEFAALVAAQGDAVNGVPDVVLLGCSMLSMGDDTGGIFNSPH